MTTKVAEGIYKNAQAQQQAAGGPPPGGDAGTDGENPEAQSKNGDDVIDADYKEV